MPSQQELRRLFIYDPSTGVVTNRRNGRPAGTPHGHKYPYKVVRLNYKSCFLHRLIWIYVHGEIPAGRNIDHINGFPDDNRLGNLRLATQSQNIRNLKLRSDNTSGFHGISWHKRSKKWMARIKGTNGYVYLGVYNDKADAITARKNAERKYAYHPNHGRTQPLTAV